MRIIADLHLHSKYARATSPSSDLQGLSEGAKIKGVQVVATGDFTHPAWFRELGLALENKDNASGLYDFNGVKFILSVEVSNIFELKGKTKKMHHVLLAPNFEVAAQINDALAKYGNLEEDGRPTLMMSSAELLEITDRLSKDIFVIPAHIWTPWFSLFGSKSGVDDLNDAYGGMEKHIHALETGLSCYDPETEVLTESGWKKVSHTTTEDKVCTINQKNIIEFQRPTKIHKYHHKGKMYRLKTKRADLLVTPNHNLYYSPCDFRNRKPYSLKTAMELFGKSKIFKKDGVWKGRRPEHFVLPSVEIKHGSRYYSGLRKKAAKIIPIESWVKFFGFWIAEGWTSEGKDGDYNVCISNTDQELLDEMECILRSFGYELYRGKNILRVRDFQLFHYLRQFGKASEKYIPKGVKSLSKELLNLLLEYYIEGDGHRYGRTGKGLSATTISKRLRDDLQEIALKVGMSAYYKKGNPKGTPFKSPGQAGKIYEQSADAWVIYFIRKNEHIVLPSTIKKHGHIEEWADYDDEVFCVTVPNHVIYIRRNGIPLWCGNSDPAMNWMVSKLDRYALVSNSDSHSPEKMGREANVFELEEVSYGAILEAIKTRKGFVKTYEFFPEEGKYHYDGHRNCNVLLDPWEAQKLGNRCPVCKKPLTIGVMHRVADLADRKLGEKPANAVPFKHIVPLPTVIAKAIGKGEVARQVGEEYDRLIRYFGNEFAIYEANDEQLRLATDAVIAGAIAKVNAEKVHWIPGYDGVFGELILDDEKAEEIGRKAREGSAQKGLGEFL